MEKKNEISQEPLITTVAIVGYVTNLVLDGYAQRNFLGLWSA